MPKTIHAVLLVVLNVFGDLFRYKIWVRVVIKFMTEITVNVENRSIDNKIWLKDTVYIYMLLIERNQTDNRVLDLKSTFKMSNIFSWIIYIV